ncbi:TetR/AcrR family transcriptional regulator [Promicromonospora iranensis]|uniref:AcrR family transcriptional regulator n=1 Tax=Promicromonospora iranensis TaxID=1105144 RepID=A0ABU2CQB7_9MICO|nr:TetR/AcrR family transcriptional regulator [Promicromonospora iranensis]MDR7383461.1 AcrR family transcriptional regulator [Promicromonospora iranensis]
MTAEHTPDAGSGSSVERAFATALTPRRERTRERLLDAAFTVFAHHGIHGASIEAVCEAAGFTRGAFYSNFSSKEELFLALAERAMRQQLASLESIRKDLEPGIVQGGCMDHDAIRSILAVVVTDPGDARQWALMRAELELLAMRDPAVGRPFLAQEEMLRTEVGAAIERILNDLGLRFTVDQRTAVDLLLSVYESSARSAVVANPTAEDGDAAPDTAVLTHLVNLVVAPAD